MEALAYKMNFYEYKTCNKIFRGRCHSNNSVLVPQELSNQVVQITEKTRDGCVYLLLTYVLKNHSTMLLTTCCISVLALLPFHFLLSVSKKHAPQEVQMPTAEFGARGMNGPQNYFWGSTRYIKATHQPAGKVDLIFQIKQL